MNDVEKKYELLLKNSFISYQYEFRQSDFGAIPNEQIEKIIKRQMSEQLGKFITDKININFNKEKNIYYFEAMMFSYDEYKNIVKHAIQCIPEERLKKIRYGKTNS